MNNSKFKSKSNRLSLALFLSLIFALGANAQNAEIKQIPEMVQAVVGETFKVSLSVDFMDQPISVADLFMNFDAERLQVMSIDLVDQDLFNFHMAPTFDNESGKIRMSAFQLSEVIPEGSFELVEIEFLALSETEWTEVYHEQSLSPGTMLAYAGARVEANLNTLQVEITSADPLSDGLLSEDELSLDIWPNPASEFATITLQIPIDERVEVTLYDATGKELRSIYEGMVFSSTTNNFDLNLKHLADGLYTVEFLIGNQSITKKLVVAN